MSFSLSPFINNALPAISYGGSGAVGQAINSVVDPAGLARLTTPAQPSPVANAAPVATSGQPSDLRARLSPLSPGGWFGTGVTQILTQTNGVIFPYSPTIQFSQSVSYADLQLVHSDTDYPAYTRTPSATISVTGKFTVQNQREGQYAMAVIHFLRAASKSYFGKTDAGSGEAGLPPPVLTFSAYGAYVFNAVRCVLKSHSWSFDETTDTVAVSVGGQSVRLPALFSISCELMPVQTPRRMREDFSFNAFASGALVAGGNGWV